MKNVIARFTTTHKTNFEKLKVKFVQYKDCASLVEKFFDCPLHEVADIWVENVVEKDKPAAEYVTPGAWVKHLEKNQMWAFADIENNVIHVWVDHHAEVRELIGMLAHELGHIFMNMGWNTNDCGAVEELQADRYGAAAVMALKSHAVCSQNAWEHYKRTGMGTLQAADSS